MLISYRLDATCDNSGLVMKCDVTETPPPHGITDNYSSIASSGDTTVTLLARDTYIVINECRRLVLSTQLTRISLLH